MHGREKAGQEEVYEKPLSFLHNLLAHCNCAQLHIPMTHPSQKRTHLNSLTPVPSQRPPSPPFNEPLSCPAAGASIHFFRRWQRVKFNLLRVSVGRPRRLSYESLLMLFVSALDRYSSG